jgi:hypothetical protein
MVGFDGALFLGLGVALTLVWGGFLGGRMPLGLDLRSQLFMALISSMKVQKIVIGSLVFFDMAFGVDAAVKAMAINSLTAKSVPVGTKLVLFGRYVLNIYVGIVQYFLLKTKTWRAKIYLPTQRTNRRISYYIN